MKEKIQNLLKTAQENKNRSSENMVLRHKNKHPPSGYEKGDSWNNERWEKEDKKEPILLSTKTIKKNLKIVDVCGDGNYFFGAIAR